ncbi:MAG: EVE domain-containing protein [Waddliaceae bacterium]
MNRYWLGIVSREHVQLGVVNGFAQVCHGNRAPLSKMRSNDWIVYYSPKMSLGSTQHCKSFTAIGRIKTGDIYQATMTASFNPYRIDVEYFSSNEVPIKDVMDELELTSDKSHWGMKLRRGLVELSNHDFLVIANRMGVEVDETRFPSKYQSPAQSPGFLLWQVSNSWQRRQKEALSPLELTHVQFVLLAGVGWLQSKGQCVTQAILAKQTGSDPMMTSQVVRTLKAKGLVDRTQDPVDQRKIQIRLTELGKKLLDRAMKVVEDTDHQFFGRLDRSKQKFCESLQSLIPPD